MQEVIGRRIVQAVELVASNDQLLWCAKRIRELKKRGSSATLKCTWKTEGGNLRYTMKVCRSDGTIEDPPEVF